MNENSKGAISAFSIGADGRLTLLNQEPVEVITEITVIFALQ